MAGVWGAMDRDPAKQAKARHPQQSHHRLRTFSLRFWIVLVLVLGIIVPGAGISGYRLIPWHTDFMPFYAAGTLVRDGRAGEAYDDGAFAERVSQVVGEPTTGLHWVYPPGMFLITWPLAYLAPLPAYLVWLGIGLIGVGFVTWRLAPGTALPVFLPLCPAVTYCAITGQVSLMATALAGGGFLTLSRRPVLAGILFGVLALKIHLALLVPFCLLAGRHYRALAWMVVTAVFVELLALMLVGPESALSFLGAPSRSLEYLAAHPKLLARTPTVYSLLVGISGSQILSMAGQAIACAAAIAGVMFIWRRTDDLVARSLGWSAGLMLATPFLYDYDLAVFVIPLAAITRCALWRGIGWADAAMMTLLWSASFVLKYVAALIGFQPGPIVAAALLAYAAWLAAQPPDKRRYAMPAQGSEPSEKFGLVT